MDKLEHNFSTESLAGEVGFKASRSGGKGGQNVNKVASKAELKFDIRASLLFSDDEKKLLLSRLSHRLIGDRVIRVVSEEERSQLLNREKALSKLYLILKRALHQEKPRKATRPKKAAVEQRLKEKRLMAEKKIHRRKDYL
ncbi:MAG TPA: alternative ribosome rescue aminoacyl-tRNA hydrolase ArfB [Sphingobacteriaceae bacterium]